MPAVLIKATHSARPVRSGDFGAKVTKSELLLPEQVAKALSAQGVRTAAEAVSYLQTFPSFIARELNWDVADVARGLEALRRQLVGVVDDAVLRPGQKPSVSYGALDPRKIPGRTTPTSKP
ncbi:hypothetical protein OKW30_004636 [Paraburkholderia sp. Clong3]